MPKNCMLASLLYLHLTDIYQARYLKTGLTAPTRLMYTMKPSMFSYCDLQFLQIT